LSGAGLAFALGAAVLHAGWNVALAGSRDIAAATGGLLIWGVALLALPALLTGGVSSSAVPFVAASAALELAYFGLLARAYGGGSVSVVYPVARGSAPALVLVVGVLGLGKGVSALAAVGVLAVCAGVLLLGVFDELDTSREPFLVGRSALGRRRDMIFGLAIGATIAAYTLVDSEGVERADPIAYLALVLAPCALAYPLAARRAPDLGVRSALSAAATVGAYLLVLAALQRAPAAPVAAVRETSILLVTFFAAVFLKERLSAARIAGAISVTAGVAAIAYS
jgi:drug/metabolite transporter (DMT)-like permease